MWALYILALSRSDGAGVPWARARLGGPAHAFLSRSYLLGSSANHPTDAEHDLYYFRLSASRYLMLCRCRASVDGYDPRSPLGRQCIHTRATQPLDWCAASTQIRIFILYIVYKRILFSNLSFLLLFHSDIVRLTGLYFVSCKIYYRLHYIICNAVTHIAYKLFLAYREGNIYSTYFVLYFCKVWTLSVYGPKVVGGRGTRAAASSLDLKQEHLY